VKVVALAGGVGGARFLRGLVRVVPAADLTVIANTGDDIRMHGLHVCPDLDTITYTIGGGVHPEQGWGRADESFAVAGELHGRYGLPDWFTLGDRDIATHLLADGVTLSEVTARIAGAWGLPFTLLPMAESPVPTIIVTHDGRRLHFQEWWVRDRAEPAVAAVEFEGVHVAVPGAGVLDALLQADCVVLCPSNPVVSIKPILAVPGVAEALRSSTVVGVSPIVGGSVLRGMADRLLQAQGVEVSCVGVAATYRDFLDGWVIDEVDAEHRDEVAALGVTPAVTNTVMAGEAIAADLAGVALQLARSLI
jgi:LPPG:FO 2-phospho-L-lactate transferase